MSQELAQWPAEPDKPDKPEKSSFSRPKWLKLPTVPLGPTGPTGPTGKRRVGRIAAVVVGVVLLVAVLAGIGYGVLTAVNQSSAANAKASLDQALTNAVNLSVPPQTLQPIRDQESKIAASPDQSLGGYQHATEQYNKLKAQVTAILNTTPEQARTTAQNDLTKLSTAVSGMTKAKYAEASGYKTRMNTIQASFNKAKTVKDYFVVDGQALDQIDAIAAYKPTLTNLQNFQKLVQNEQQLLGIKDTGAVSKDLECAIGLVEQYWESDLGTTATFPATANTPIESTWVANDQAAFHKATKAADYARLNQTIASQTSQVEANQATLLPSYASQVLTTLQSNIALIQQQGGDVSTYQQQYEQDVQLLTGAPSQDNYLNAVKQMQKQMSSMQLPLIKAQTQADVKTLQGLIAQGQASKTHNPADGLDYPNAYEYADAHTGIGDATERLASAKTVDDYQLVDQELQMFITNIQAMLTNLKDPLTKANKWNVVHQTDLDLIQTYGVTDSRVMVVSLREQAARFYENGQLVKSIQVTTGAPDLPSIPGIHCVLDQELNTVFTSPDPPGSPNYYKPTPIHYGMRYSYYGYYVHDAWWRNTFGLYTNLPHHDPAAFNGGSHGCINVPLSQMSWVFDWLNYGAPIIVY